MKALFTPYITLVALLFTIASCDNINRESKDVSTNAATLSADTLETMDLDPIGGDDAELLVVEETETKADAPTASTSDKDRTYTETEVVQIDTISTRIVYDIKRRMIEEVDTVGATKTYEIRRKVLRRTVMLDTLTETNDEERTVAYQKGDYKVLDEKVETDTAVEVLDYAEAKREAAKQRAKVATTPTRTTTETTQPATTTTARDNATTQPAQQPAARSTQERATTNAADTTSTSRLPVQPSTETPAPSEQRPTRPANNATPSDTTSTESGS